MEEVVASLLFESGQLIGSVVATFRASAGGWSGSFMVPAQVKLLPRDRFRLLTADSRVKTVEVTSVLGNRIEFVSTATVDGR